MNKKVLIMKFLLMLLLPTVALAQQDFDYVLNTRHRQMTLIKDSDSSMVVLSSYRRIVKQGARLTVTSTDNTADEQEFRIEFYGVHFGPVPKDANSLLSGSETMSFQYLTEDKKFRISVWPTIPIVEFYVVATYKLFERYY